jgi:hypothetical protein
MIIIWIGILFFISSLVLVFTLALCKSAALADREFERARTADQRTWSITSESIESNKELHISTEIKPVPRFGNFSAHS